MTTFHLRSRADKLGMCKNHSMLVRNDFLLFDFELHSEKNTFSPECGSNFENCSFRLVPFTFRLSVTGP